MSQSSIRRLTKFSRSSFFHNYLNDPATYPLFGLVGSAFFGFMYFSQYNIKKYANIRNDDRYYDSQKLNEKDEIKIKYTNKNSIDNTVIEKSKSLSELEYNDDDNLTPIMLIANNANIE